MREIQLRHNMAQFAIDMLFGAVLLLPLGYGLATGSFQESILVTIGVGVGYVLHMVQKILLYEELLSEEVRTHVEDKVDETVPEAVEEEVNGE